MRFNTGKFWFRVEILLIELLNFHLLLSLVIQFRLLERLLGSEPDCLCLDAILNLHLAPQLRQLLLVDCVLSADTHLQLFLFRELFHFHGVFSFLIAIHLFKNSDAFLKFVDELGWLVDLRLSEPKGFILAQEVYLLEERRLGVLKPV